MKNKQQPQMMKRLEKIIITLVLISITAAGSAWVSFHNFKIEVQQQIPRIETALTHLANSNNLLSNAINKFDKSIGIFERDRLYIIKHVESNTSDVKNINAQMKKMQSDVLRLEFKQ